MAINVLDIAIIVIYFFGLIAIGVIVSRRIKTHEDSMVAGRSFGSFLAGVGKAANLAGGSTSVGGTGYGYTYGISGSWFGIANIILGLVLAPIAPRIWRAMTRGGFTSVGEYLGYRFGRFAQVFAGFLNTCAFIGFVSAQIVATATIMTVLFGWDYTFSAVISTVIVYTILGGLKAVVYTDCMQMAIIYLGIVIILPIMAVHAVGGFGEIWSNIPTNLQQIGSMGWFQIIGVILIPTITAPFTIQSTYTYTAACKTAKTARNANLWGSLFYAFPAFAVILIGLCCYVMYPDLASDQDALPTIITELLPNGLMGLLLAAVLSATMSTSSTGLLCAVNCFTSDVVFVIRDAIKNRSDRKIEEGKATEGKKEVLTLAATRIVIAIIGVFTLIGSLYFPNIIELILLGYSLICGGLLVPAVATMFSKRATKPAAIVSMLSGGISYLILSFTVSWPAIFLAVPISAVLMIVVSLCTKKPDPLTYDLYFEGEWEQSPNNPQNRQKQ